MRNAPTVLISCPECGAAAQVEFSPVAVTYANCGHADAIVAWLESTCGRRWLATYLLASESDVDPCFACAA